MGQLDCNQLRAVNKLLERGLRQLEIVDISSSGEHSGTTQGVVGAVPVSAVVMDIALELRGLIPYQTRWENRRGSPVDCSPSPTMHSRLVRHTINLSI